MMDAKFSAGWAPGSDGAVIVACDANYLPYAALPALALAGRGGFDVLIGGPEPLDLPGFLREAGVGQVASCPEALNAALPLDARRSLAAYMHVFLAGSLRGVYRRILVIDTDIIYERGDPARLLRADMHGHAVAAVRDNRQWRHPSKRVPDQRRLGRPAAPYFNSGVVMIDPERWAETDMPARCAAFARDRLAGIGRDQALVNGVLDGDWAEINPLWNWQFTGASSLLAGMADPCMIHFIGPKKPWLDSSAGVVPMRWRAPYGACLARHFPDRPHAAEPDRRHWPDRWTLGKILFRQWRASGPMLDYLNRFPDEYTLLEPR